MSLSSRDVISWFHSLFKRPDCSVSTFVSNLALALKNKGCEVVLIDADIYGPSLPKLFYIGDKPENELSKIYLN